MNKVIRLWYDKEGGFLEIIFNTKPGYSIGTEEDGIIKRIDEEGNLLSIGILELSSYNLKTLEISI